MKGPYEELFQARMKGGLSRIETGKQFTSRLPRGLCEQVRFRLPRLGFIIDAKAIDYH